MAVSDAVRGAFSLLEKVREGQEDEEPRLFGLVMDITDEIAETHEVLEAWHEVCEPILKRVMKWLRNEHAVLETVNDLKFFLEHAVVSSTVKNIKDKLVYAGNPSSVERYRRAYLFARKGFSEFKKR